MKPGAQERRDSTRRAWDAAAPVHAQSQFERLARSFADPEYLSLDDTERRLLAELGVQGRRVAQPCCNNARELISVARLGAARCTGFDFSEAFLAQGRQLAAAAGVGIELVPCDVLEVPARYDGAFDIVYVTVGAITWLADLEAFYRSTHRLLAPGGRMLLYDMHPILWQYEDGPGGFAARAPYFDPEPYRSEDGLDYFTGSRYETPPAYCHQHTLGDIVSKAVQAGFQIDRLQEYDHDVSNLHGHMDDWAVRPPRSFHLTARRP